MDSIIESALQPGRLIGWNEGSSFVSDLRHLESEIAKVVSGDPARGVVLYETFIAGCTLKAEEIDDSDGEFGTFACGLYCDWITARQAAGADRGQTAKLLLAWMDDDDYGFCNDLERAAVKVLDRAGLEAFEREVRARFDTECATLAKGKRPVPNPDYARDHWSGMLRAIYSEQRNIEKYLDLTSRTGLTQADCEAIATMFQAKRKPNDALAWVEQGIQMDKPDAFQRGAGDKLAEMRRALLAKLGRGNETLDSAWAEFQAHPDKTTYDELIRYVPKAERGAWHEKAMAASEQGDLGSLIELWLGAKEIDRLAARLERTSDTQLEGLSHYLTEAAAWRLAKTHPPWRRESSAHCVCASSTPARANTILRPCRTWKRPGGVTKRLGSTASGRRWLPKSAGIITASLDSCRGLRRLLRARARESNRLSSTAPVIAGRGKPAREALYFRHTARIVST